MMFTTLRRIPSVQEFAMMETEEEVVCERRGKVERRTF